ncbi:MAG: murein biosynthesis integral membrane protein MurJ [Bryobacteraceae bacterium]|nr:murein biosynthesis integral membrane protein MurJ [Bryobacteraceae bacterium]
MNAETDSTAHHEVVRSAGVVSLAVLGSRLTGLLREIVMARLFGAGMAYDAFLLAFRIPNLTRDLFAEGALSSAFVPTFAEYLVRKGQAAARELANQVATALIVVVGSLCLLGIFFSPGLVWLLAPGWVSEAAKFELAVRMTRVMFPFLLLVALAAQAMGILNACQQFGLPASASTFFNLGSLGFGLLIGFGLGPYLGLPPIEGMAYGVLLGGMLQLGGQLPSLWRRGFRYRPQLDWSHPGLRQIIRLMAPALLGSAAVQINVLVNTNFASTVIDPLRGPDGPVSWLSYAFRFMQLPLGLFGVAIASATLPAISRSAASGDLEQFRDTLSRSLGLVFLLTLPSSVGLAVLGRPLIGAIYEGGRFEPYDTIQTAHALTAYAVGLAGYAAVKVLTPGFYALGDARTPMLVSLCSILVNYIAAWSMTRRAGMGHTGLALATSIVMLFSVVALFWKMRERLGELHGRRLASSLLRIGVASAAMGLVVAGCCQPLETQLGAGRLASLVQLALGVPLGAGCYYWLCRALRVGELESASRALAVPLARLLRATAANGPGA